LAPLSFGTLIYWEVCPNLVFFAAMNVLKTGVKKQLIQLAKWAVVGAAFYFIYAQLQGSKALDWTKIEAVIYQHSSLYILFILSLSFWNRYFEILKWQNLVQSFRPLSVGQSSAQVFGALTAGIFTPNGFGEYAGKALFFEKAKAKKIIFLNLLCNGIQMVITVLFGGLGLWYFNAHYPVISTASLVLILGGIAGVLSLLFLIKKISIKGYSLERLGQKIKKIPRHIHQKNALLGLSRYLVFSHQYYFLFLLFGVDLPYLILMSAITSIYFLSSSLPSFQFLDFAVKGSVALFFCGLLGINSWIPLLITSLMWFLNVVIPVIIGSYFVLNFKPVPAP
jgi:hypothetical protein